MRVFSWTPDGIRQIGELPWSPPQPPPATLWFIEPSGVLDRAKLVQVVAAMRRERAPGLSLRGQPIAPWLGELRGRLEDEAAGLLRMEGQAKLLNRCSRMPHTYAASSACSKHSTKSSA